MKITKKIFLTSFIVLLVGVFAFGFLGNKTKAAPSSCTSTGTGNWSAGGTWDCGHAPTNADAVYVTGGFTVTLDTNGEAAAIYVEQGATLTIPGSQILSVLNNIEINAPAGGGTSTFAIGNGYVTAVALTVNGIGVGKEAEATISGGTLDLSVSYNATFGSFAAASKLTSTGASSIRVGANFGVDGGGMGTFDGTGSTLFFDGGIAQSMGASTGYNNVTIGNTAGGVTMPASGTLTINGTLTVSEGVLDTNKVDLTVGFGTVVGDGGTLLISNTAGSKTFTGDIDILAGGIWSETAGEDLVFGGGFNNAGTFTASTGVHDFTGAGKVIFCEDPTFDIPDLKVTGTVTNAARLTVSSSLGGGGTLTNSDSAILMLSGGVSITGLTATANSNQVYYDGAGDQTVKEVDYYNLFLTGSGNKSIGSGISIIGAFSVETSAIAKLTGASDASVLYLDSVEQDDGTWGATGSGATNINDTFFSGAGTLAIPDITPPTFTAVRTAVNTIELTFSEDINASADTDAWTVAGASAVSSSAVVSDTTMILTTTGLTDTDGTPEVNYVQANGDVADLALNPLADGGAINAEDEVPPVVSSITMSDYNLTVGETATVTVVFSEPITGFALVDVTAPNGVLSGAGTLDQITYTATFTPNTSVNDATNVLTVGTGYTDQAAALNAPVASADSSNYTVNTVVVNTSHSSTGGSTSVKPSAPTLTPPTDCLSGYLYSPSTGKPCNTSTPTSPTTKFIFTKNLKYLMLDNEVKELQKFLNTHGYPVSLTGAGSSGLETTKFGSLTQKALIKFQKANNITPAVGYFGPITRAKVNSLN
jgi:hypothetical protein